MKKSKRFLAVLMALSMLVALAACTPEETGDTSTDPSANQQTDEGTLAPGETGGSGASGSDTQPEESKQDLSGVETSAVPAQGQEKPSAEKTTAPNANTDPTKMSRAELVNYYNTAANDAKKNAKSITKTKSIAKKVSDPEMPDNENLAKAADFLMNQFLKTKDVNEVYSSAAEKKANFPVKNQDYSSKLTANDVSSASCSRSGANYVITLEVKPAGISKAFNSVSKQEILDGASGFATFNSVNIAYDTCAIKATVSSNGKLQKVEYDQPRITMEFGVSKVLKIFPMDVKAKIVIGLGDWFTINW